jgi:hypothetical protein
VRSCTSSTATLADYSKDFAPGTLTGAKGTLPGAETGASLKSRLLEVNPKLTDYSYAPESYDAAVLIALAAEAAKDDSGVSIAGKLKEISEGGEKCKEFKLVQGARSTRTRTSTTTGFSAPHRVRREGQPDRGHDGHLRVRRGQQVQEPAVRVRQGERLTQPAHDH